MHRVWSGRLWSFDHRLVTVAQSKWDYSELYISDLLLWLWLMALKNTPTNLLHHGCSQCSSNLQGQHSETEYWSAHKCELNRMSMIDLICGASSLGQIHSRGSGDLFCWKASLLTVEFCIRNATTRLHKQLKWDARHVLHATVWIWLWNMSLSHFPAPLAQKKISSPSSISSHFHCHTIS